MPYCAQYKIALALLVASASACSSNSDDARLTYTWSLERFSITVAANMTVTNVSRKAFDQVLTKCSVVAGGKTFSDHLEGGVLNGILQPGETRTWRSVTLGSSPTDTDNVTAVTCRVSKVNRE